MTDINDLTAQEYYDKLTEYTRQHVQATQALDILGQFRPDEKVRLPLPIIESADDLGRYFVAEDERHTRATNWQKEYDTAENEYSSAVSQLRHTIPDSMRNIWFKIELDDKAWGVKKLWSRNGGHNIIVVSPWDEVLDFFSEEENSDE
jgi:hypothetical protein